MSILPHYLLLLFVAGYACAQEQAAYIPFAWNDQRPVSATNLGVDSAGRTTWGLYDLPGDKNPGPATVVQGPSSVTMIYNAVIYAKTTAFSGRCVTATPLAVCGVNLINIPQITGPALEDIGVGQGGGGGTVDGFAQPGKSDAIDGRSGLLAGSLLICILTMFLPLLKLVL